MRAEDDINFKITRYNEHLINNKGSFTYYVISRGGGGGGFQMLTVDYGGGGGGVWSLIT